MRTNISPLPLQLHPHTYPALLFPEGEGGPSQHVGPPPPPKSPRTLLNTRLQCAAANTVFCPCQSQGRLSLCPRHVGLSWCKDLNCALIDRSRRANKQTKMGRVNVCLKRSYIVVTTLIAVSFFFFFFMFFGT